MNRREVILSLVAGAAAVALPASVAAEPALDVDSFEDEDGVVMYSVKDAHRRTATMRRYSETGPEMAFIVMSYRLDANGDMTGNRVLLPGMVLRPGEFIPNRCTLSHAPTLDDVKAFHAAWSCFDDCGLELRPAGDGRVILDVVNT